MLSVQSIEILLDLVEIKISTMIVQDKDDLRELKRLKNCRSELVNCSKEVQKRRVERRILDSIVQQVPYSK